MQAPGPELWLNLQKPMREGESVDDAQLRQRSDEYSERELDRQDNERRYERSQRRKRDSDYRDHSDEY
jgi:hypothetical protein